MTTDRHPKTARKSLGLTQARKTPKTVGVTDSAATPLTPMRKRKYKARARKCKCCGTPFTPSRNSDAKFCSASCRNKVWRKQHPKPAQPAEPMFSALICEHCRLGYFGSEARGQKFCSASCRTLSWKVRRAAAVVALSEGLGMSLAKAADVVEAAGMVELKRMLGALGLEYDTSARRWGVRVDQVAFVRQEA